MKTTRWFAVIVSLAWGVAYGSDGRSLVTPHNLRLVGGYRLPTFYQHAEAIRTSAFPRGGMAAWTSPAGQLTVWHENGEQGRQILESRAVSPMGRANESPIAWPLLTEGAVWNSSELFPASNDGFLVPEGLAFDPEAQRLWVSMRSIYATNPDPPQWLAAIDYPTENVHPVRPNLPTLSAQFYGGGLTIIPSQWAAEYTSGNRLGFASGGYVSGQRASMGPTFAFTSLTPQAQPAVGELMYFADTATVGADQTQNAPSFLHRHKVAKSFADYGPALDWVYPAEAGVGYWPGSTIRGSGTWINHPQLEGVLYMANRPIGTLDYARQTETFALTTANTLYVVPPDVLAQSATAARSAIELADELKFFDWNATNNGGIQQIARGLSYDPGTGYVWIYYPQVWSGGVERYPIVAAYQLVPGRREDLNQDGTVDGLDAAILLAAWGRTSGSADLDRDGIVDGADIGALFNAWTGDRHVASLPEPTPLQVYRMGVLVLFVGRRTVSRRDRVNRHDASVKTITCTG